MFRRCLLNPSSGRLSHHTINAFGVCEGKARLSQCLGSSCELASRFGSFTPGKEFPVPIGQAGPRSGMGVAAKRNIAACVRNRTLVV
jgi:hypothetical protein